MKIDYIVRYFEDSHYYYEDSLPIAEYKYITTPAIPRVNEKVCINHNEYNVKEVKYILPEQREEFTFDDLNLILIKVILERYYLEINPNYETEED